MTAHTPMPPVYTPANASPDDRLTAILVRSTDSWTRIADWQAGLIAELQADLQAERAAFMRYRHLVRRLVRNTHDGRKPA